MKKLLLTLMLAVVSSSVMADWVEVGSSYISYAATKITAYANPTSIHKVGDIVIMRTRVDFKPVEMVDGKKQKSIFAKDKSVESSQGEFDCKNDQSRAAASYEWAPVSPDSIDETLWKFACGK